MDWPTLSPEETEKLRLQRHRSNQISKLMGVYLLKGYRMLGTTCNKCQAILMQDRQGEDYCIGCCEVDAAIDTSQEVSSGTSQAVNEALEHSSEAAQLPSSPSNNRMNGTSSWDSLHVSSSVPALPRSLASSTVHSLTNQIHFLNDQLAQRKSPQELACLVSTLKQCYETIDLIQKNFTGSSDHSR